MKFYLVTLDGQRRLVTRKDEAGDTPEVLDIPVDQTGLKAFVEDLFDQIDAIPAPVEGVPPPAPPPQERELTYTEVSMMFEEAFPNFPLKLQLHYAAHAMEHARDRIKD